ncbi:restriction endonuclease subunit S [Lamprobacter modestohalophilus]|uniref:restriction endonuclease subunit S n=1 Tax=Lamprobacter modestohalophilus TaxID=1064514 RepID=UPI002ADEAB2E|nr:restriction endonuclease subunit S [Lamprobacter modestohalophilus]MEA1051334.1 restriction endonuclease subunit S [Lamprobacter modestohalophilus]
MTLAAYPTYESYKDSGVEWISEVPKEWNVKRLKHLARQVSDKVSSKDSPLRYIGMENVESWSGHLIDGNVEVEGLAAKFAPNDVIFGKLRPYLAKTKKLSFSGICSTEFIVFRTERAIEPDFLAYLLRSPDFVSYIDSSTYGSKMPRANPNFIANCPIVVPPIPEQRAIAACLDEKCAKIDEAVRIKEAQIALLSERRQILIQEAVTRGLNPGAPMKESGIDWIGQIPAHWERRKIKQLFRLVVEPAEKRNSHELLSIYTDIGVRPRKELEERGNKASTTDGYWIVNKGDFIVNKLLAWMGAIGLSEYDGVTSPAYDILRPRVSLNGEYFHRLFRSKSFSLEIKRFSRGIMEMRLRIYFDKLGILSVPCPPKHEQDAIIAYLNKHEQSIESAISIKYDQITALKEYKTCLINAAVTGKIKLA